MSQGSGVQIPPGVFAGVAQSVERMTLNHVVAGSSPAIGKRKIIMNFNQRIASLPNELIRKILIFRRPHPIARLFKNPDFLENEIINNVKKSWTHHLPDVIVPWNSALEVWRINKNIPLPVIHNRWWWRGSHSFMDIEFPAIPIEIMGVK